MRSLHVGAAQLHSGGGVEDVLRRAERQVAAASRLGVQVLLFSEGALHGYDYDLDHAFLERVAEPCDGPGCRRVSALASAGGLVLLMGFFERDGDRFYNSQLVARPDGSTSVQRKAKLTEGETRAGLTPGPEERSVFEVNGVRCAVIICADTGIEELHGMLRRLRVDYRFIPTGGGGKLADMMCEADLDTEAGRERYLANRPRVCKSEGILEAEPGVDTGFTSANALGPVGRRTCHQGHCMIVDNRQVLRAQIPGTIVIEHQQDQLIHAELAFD